MASTTSRGVRPTFGPTVDVNLELRLGAAECRQRRDRDELSLAQVEDRARVDVAECEFDDLRAEVRGDLLRTLDDARSPASASTSSRRAQPRRKRSLSGALICDFSYPVRPGTTPSTLPPPPRVGATGAACLSNRPRS